MKSKKLIFLLVGLLGVTSCQAPTSVSSSSGPSSNSDFSSEGGSVSGESHSKSEISSQTPSSEAHSSQTPSSEAHSSQTPSSETPSSEQPQSSAQQPSSVSSEDIAEHLPVISYVKVFCPTSFNTLYTWDDSVTPKEEMLGGWPGSSTALQIYDENWKYYDFIGRTEANFIFSKNGKEQTDDLFAAKPGYYWYYDGVVHNQDYDPVKYGSTDTPTGKQGNYELVQSAKDYTELPAMQKFAANSVVNAYQGTRTDFRDESIYFAMTTRFYDGDPSNNAHCWDGVSRNLNVNDPEWRGDFKGLIEKMDYIKALGFTAIWITPIVKNGSSYDYHGYHAINFKEVDPRYESEDVKFQDVINAAHARDMKIVLDVVFNHTCNFGEENLFPMFNYDPGTDPTFNGMVRNEEYGLLPASYDKSTGAAQFSARINTMKKDTTDSYHVYHHELSFGYEQYIEQTGQMADDCVDLNTENPTVANYLIEAYGKFIQMGVDAFRIDTMKHISRLTLNKYFFPGLKAIANKVGNPYFHMFGEVCSRWSESVWNHMNPNCSAPFYTWAETSSPSYAWGDRVTNERTTKTFYDDHYDLQSQPESNNHRLNGVTYHAPNTSRFNNNSVIDFQMHWNFENASKAYNFALGWDKTYQDATYNVVYVDSHDYGPQNQEKVRYEGGTSAWKENMSLMFTFRGVPCIYYGSEVEFKKGAVIDVGPNADLEDTGRAYFGENIKGSVTATGFGSYTNASGNVANTLNSTLSQHLRKLGKARVDCYALRRGQYTIDNVYNNNSMAAFTRRYTANGIDSIACVVISGSASFSNLPNGTYRNLYGGGTTTVSNGNLSASALGQGNVAIWVKQ